MFINPGAVMFIGRIGLVVARVAVGIAATVFAGVGVVAAPGGRIAGFVILAGVVGALAAGHSGVERPAPLGRTRSAWFTGAAAAGAAFVALLVLNGLVAALGPPAVSLLLLLGLAVAAWVRWRARPGLDHGRAHQPSDIATDLAGTGTGTGTGTETETEAGAAVDAAAGSAAGGRSLGPGEPTGGGSRVGDVATFSTAQLCLQWRRSYLALARAQDPQRREQIAALRRRCLDEIERRHPHDFARWIDSGARAAGDPGRFLPPPPPGSASEQPSARQHGAAAGQVDDGAAAAGGDGDADPDRLRGQNRRP